VDAVLAESVDQNTEQVGAMSMVIGRAETRLRLAAQRCPKEALAGVPGTVVAPLRTDGDPRQRLVQAQPPEHPRRIGAELDAGPDLSKCVRLLEQERIDAVPAQGKRRPDAADPVTGKSEP
jgi:hypothetical protein